jgi:hypothetical protein
MPRNSVAIVLEWGRIVERLARDVERLARELIPMETLVPAATPWRLGERQRSIRCFQFLSAARITEGEKNSREDYASY